MRQNAAGGDFSLPDDQAVQRFDGKNLNFAEVHQAFNTAMNYLAATKNRLEY
jgi:hypothetical protein